MGGESKSMESCIRVFIADSTRDGADLLRRALEPETDLSVVGVALSGDEALRRFPESGADVLLSDNFFDMNAGEKRVKVLRGTPGAVTVRSVFNIG